MVKREGHYNEHSIRWDQEDAPNNVDESENAEQSQRPMLVSVHVVQDILIQPELEPAQYQQNAPQEYDDYNVQSKSVRVGSIVEIVVHGGWCAIGSHGGHHSLIHIGLLFDGGCG